jgi:prepilin peptidase CpaA
MNTTAPFMVILLLAAFIDLLTNKVPNILILPSLLLAFLLAYLNGGAGLLLNSILGAGVGFLVLLYPYSKSLIGAGDVKLMAVVGAFLGPKLVLLAVLYASVFGGLIVLIYLAYKGLLAQSFRRAMSLQFSSARIPYACAISAGSCLTLFNLNYP